MCIRDRIWTILSWWLHPKDSCVVPRPPPCGVCVAVSVVALLGWNSPQYFYAISLIRERERKREREGGGERCLKLCVLECQLLNDGKCLGEGRGSLAGFSGLPNWWRGEDGGKINSWCGSPLKFCHFLSCCDFLLLILFARMYMQNICDDLPKCTLGITEGTLVLCSNCPQFSRYM